tara:strand:- start:43 stop:450 length:408 start_codon:yes stop_codon:yes gene_type:complete
MRKYFYFRTEAAVGDDDDIATSLMIPVDAVKAMYPTSDTALTITFEPGIRVRGEGANATGNWTNNDSVVLNVNANSHREVMYAMARAANATGPQYNDGVITVADDAADDSNASTVYLHSDITSCGAIAIAAAFAD